MNDLITVGSKLSVEKNDKVSIIILCWNNVRYTEACVEQLYKVTSPGFELILVDNFSTDNTKNVISALKEKYRKQGHSIKCLFHEKNLGFAKGNNNALKIATKPYICFLNNDILPQYNWLEKMVDVLKVKPKAGVVGARLYFPKDLKRGWVIQHAGITFINGEPKHIGRNQEDAYVKQAGIKEVEAITGACMLVRRKLARFNEEFIRGYYEDVDLCLRIRKRGYKIYVNHEAKLVHYEGVSHDIAKEENRSNFDEITLRNEALFHSLWDERIKRLPQISERTDTSRISHVKKIEIGGGINPLYYNYGQVDLRKIFNVKYVNDARMLPFPSNSLSDICSCYMLQCLTGREAEIALIEWHRCLKFGGKLELHVPDLEKVMKVFISTKNESLLREIYGEQKHELDHYKYGWTFQTLNKLLSKTNFIKTTRIKSLKNKPYSLSVIAYKPDGDI